MKEDTKETAVELLKEWKKLKMDIETDNRTLDNPTKFVVPNMEKVDVISRRLDEMCEAAGISIRTDVDLGLAFVYSFDELRENHESGRGYIDSVETMIPAREQQAIQEWLLIKNEEKTA